MDIFITVVPKMSGWVIQEFQNGELAWESEPKQNENEAQVIASAMRKMV